MKIELDRVSKKYGSQWIFRDLSITLDSSTPLAIIGANGSGKSTLLKMIAGIISPNKGAMKYSMRGNDISIDDLYLHLSYAAPYLDLPEELTVAELIAFHQSMRRLIISAQELLNIIQIDPAKEVRNCSSGMKQRIKLALAYYSISDLLLLDEPTATMDVEWKGWYHSLIQSETQSRLTLICSNDIEEYAQATVAIKL